MNLPIKVIVLKRESAIDETGGMALEAVVRSAVGIQNCSQTQFQFEMELSV